MKTRPKIFRGHDVRAIREGRKTQTRRVIKPQPECLEDVQALQYHIATGEPLTIGRGCPYGQPGDRLWVRETFRSKQQCGETIDWTYRADCPALTEYLFPWKPSIFMPRQASRITLQIVSVRVERLWDISEEDAKAEGCNRFIDSSGSYDARVQFSELWESINGPGSWDLNPWVWVVEFKEVKS